MANPEPAQASPDAVERRDPSAENKFRRAIYGVPVTLTVSIGERRMSVTEVLQLAPESIVALNTKIEDPVSLMVDDRLIAKGELIETEDGGIGVKITEIAEDADDATGS
ncbi:FliM/FliN family flagellar motor switch protein [Henriciella sp. AS95]|uniref:FliM/FliN family flagellar motor switch protein n=1 Tax=Henriciella sp. AS95 TaxID=3135782 RepID=UPI00317DF485